MAGELRDPVVIGLKAGPLELDVFEVKQKHAQRGVQHLALDPVNVLVFETLGWIPAAGSGLLVANILIGLQLFRVFARGKAAADRKGSQALSHKKAAGFALMVFDYARGTVTKRPVDPLQPQIGRFHGMRVRRENCSVCHSRPSWVIESLIIPQALSVCQWRKRYR